jgi:large subunit ribosomal protein L25
MIHDGVRVRDLDSGGRWKAVSEPELLIVHLVAPKTEAEPAAAEGAPAAASAGAEPEVIKKGKTEKEGEKE